MLDADPDKAGRWLKGWMEADAEIKEAKKMVRSGKKTKSDVARLFDVHPSTIGRLVGTNGGTVDE